MGKLTVDAGCSDDENGETYHVLVVDDDSAVAAVVAETLEHVDDALQTTHATDSHDALTQLRQGQVDCLVTDYEMPDIDGLALVDRDESDTPFIVFSQHRDDWIPRAAADRGGAYIRKQAGSEQYHRLAALIREQLEAETAG